MKTKDFYFDLPEELIAQHPLKNRESSKLMVVDKTSGEITHKYFSGITQYFSKGDCLVINDTRVIPARLYGEKEKTGGKVEFLLLKKVEESRWETLVKPGRKAKIGAKIVFGEGLLKGTIVDMGEEGSRIIEFHYEGIFEEILDQLGEMPLPPYITEKLDEKERYQTIYSKNEGSAAAPTAGLHFTQQLLDKIKDQGVEIISITLHVGLGTFRPVKVRDIHQHKMHAEYYEISKDAAERINRVKERGGKVFSVGTTSTRTLESASDDHGIVQPKKGWTDIFIYPGYRFKVVDRLITNFHLPESTLIMLVSAFANREIVLKAYKKAVKERYRFFSFGDAMLLK